MKILVIGESCLDVFHYGDCKRLCPEAPVPVFSSIETKENGGMAMNVYSNVKAINKNVDIFTNRNWKSIKKTRFIEINSNHMFMRLDENDNKYGNFIFEKEKLKNYDAIIVSDYNKGFLTVSDLINISKNHPLTFLDTKKTLNSWSQNFTFVKINGTEYDKTKHSISKQMYDNLIITQGKKGCIYRGVNYSVDPVEVKDVSGAGDTFISGLCCEFLKTRDIKKSIIFANECATKVVQKRGVSTI
jgi:D-beta-D-heptose 7-phosphate kinase/D-beta-D-heptose 1-phosphate adenosyltransferase